MTDELRKEFEALPVDEQRHWWPWFLAKLQEVRGERREAIMMLRQVCKYFGDNEWSDELHMADIIEKHLWNHLEYNNKSLTKEDK